MILRFLKMYSVATQQLPLAETREDWERVWLFSVLFEKPRYSNERSTKFESLPGIEASRGGD